MKSSPGPLILMICSALLIFADACREKSDPVLEPVIYGREGDTCRLAKTTFGFGHYLAYQYANRLVGKITLHRPDGDYPNNLAYDAAGKLQKITGAIGEVSYEYDPKGRVVKESRILSPNSGAHYDTRIFEYNEADQIVKCSYVEGRGTGYFYEYVKTGEVYRYDVFEYDVQGDVISMVVFERKAKEIKFTAIYEYAYFYDKLINPFYGHPGIFDYYLYLDADIFNLPMVLSKHNIVRRAQKLVGSSAQYIYSSTRYPLKGLGVPWLDREIVDLTMEYENCQ